MMNFGIRTGVAALASKHDRGDRGDEHFLPIQFEMSLASLRLRFQSNDDILSYSWFLMFWRERILDKTVPKGYLVELNGSICTCLSRSGHLCCCLSTSPVLLNSPLSYNLRLYSTHRPLNNLNYSINHTASSVLTRSLLSCKISHPYQPTYSLVSDGTQ